MSDIPPPPPGFSIDEPPAKPKRKRKGLIGGKPDLSNIKVRQGDLPPVTGAVDGDTLRTDGGPNVRLWGVDAPELRQPGYNALLQPVPVGQQSRNALLDLTSPGAITGPVVSRSYGRPVAPFTVNAGPFGISSYDVGEQMIRGGNAFAAPGYLSSDPARQFQYAQAERLARQNQLGPVHDNAVEDPADYRARVKDDPDYVAPRETVAVFADTPTPRTGLTAEVEQGIMARTYDAKVPVAEVYDYAKANGAILKPGTVEASRDFYLKSGKAGGLEYLPEEQVLTDSGDGAGGAAVRGIGKGFLAGGLDEAGAFPDMLGLTPGRENVFNSDRRLADIWANNQRQNASILGYDSEFHPYASGAGEVAGALTSGIVIPWGAGARTVPQLARVGGAWGAAEGFLGTDGGVPERLTGAAIGAPVGAVLGAGLGKAAEYAAPVVGRGVKSLFGRGAKGAAESTGEMAEDRAQQAARDEWADFPDAQRNDGRQASSDVRSTPAAPGQKQYTVEGGDNSALVDGSSISQGPRARRPVAPVGRNNPQIIGMEAELQPSLTASAPVRQRDVIDVSPPVRPGRMDQPLSDAQREALSKDIRPQDVLARPSNEIASVEEAAARDAGRFAPAKALNERGALQSRTVKNWMGRDVPKVGPVDLVGFLRLRGGLNDTGDDLGKGGNLKAMGLTNGPRKGMDFVGQEHRFGPLVNNDNGMSLDEAALQAWEAGYFPDHAERPSVNEFLDALGETYNGSGGRRFLPEDWDEIDRFYGLQSDRYALEQAQHDAGGKVYVDRSQPADEPQPFPPVEAYDDRLAETAKRAGNIDLTKLDTPQDIRRALVQTERAVGFDAATRGRITQAETEALAADLGMTADKLLSRRKGQALNAEEALAARQILAKSGNELVNAAKAIQRLDEPGDELMAEFRRKWMRHVAIHEQVSGMTAEAGRALQQFRQAADSRAVRGDVLSAIVTGGGGKDNLRDAANLLLEAVEDGAGKFNTVAEKAARPKWRDKISEFYINMLLSGPQTHAVNMASNTLTAIAQVPEYAAGAIIGGARRAVSRGEVDRVLGSEVGARAFGLLQGAKEGARLFARAIKTGDASDFASKVEGQQYRAIEGVKGEVIRIPTRLLTAEDELFKGIARRMELNASAVRIAAKEELHGAERKARIAELVANPTDEMFERALDYGRYLTFQRKLGPLAQKVSALTGDSLLAKLFLPFVRTPTNLLKFAAERSPAAPLLKEWRADFAAGGARRDMALARAMLGTGFGMAIYEAALDGKITGSAPSDPRKARLLYADGWQPYSLKLGDQWYSYKRLDPFSTTLGVAADLATLPEGMSERQREDKTTLLVASITGNLASKTWLSGLSDLVEAWREPDRYASTLKNRLITSFLVPNLSAQVARTVDPVRREREGLGQEIQSRIPGLSDNLLPQRDIWGQPIANGDNLGPDILSPVWVSEQLNDPVNKALLPLDYAPGYPSRKIGGQELSPEDYDKYLARAGQASHDGLTALVTGPAWSILDYEEKVKAARKVVADARRDARAELFGADKGPDGPDDGDGIPPPPPGFRVEGESAGRNVYADLQRVIPGVRLTSGFRTPEYQEQMRQRGYSPAQNSAHLNGSALDLLPPPGKSMGWLKAQVKRYDPKARLLDEGDHLHAIFPGYYGAPVLGGARAAGLRNPFEGIPPPPPGFTVN